MSRRHQPVNERESTSAGGENTGSKQTGPAETPPRRDGFYRMAMLLWGLPLLLFIAVAVLKGQCGW
jgi:hypothetical protein